MVLQKLVIFGWFQVVSSSFTFSSIVPYRVNPNSFPGQKSWKDLRRSWKILEDLTKIFPRFSKCLGCFLYISCRTMQELTCSCKKIQDFLLKKMQLFPRYKILQELKLFLLNKIWNFQDLIKTCQIIKEYSRTKILEEISHISMGFSCKETYFPLRKSNYFQSCKKLNFLYWLKYETSKILPKLIR